MGINEEDIAVLLNAALTRRPKAATHWSVRDLADETATRSPNLT